MPQSPQKTTLRIPQLTLHKATGQARVRLHGRDIYLGTYGSAEAEERYRRLIAEWLSGQLPVPQRPSTTGAADVVSVNALIYRYLEWAKGYYVKGGRPSSGYGSMQDAARALRQHYGRTPVSEFGPLKLKAIREALIAAGLSRSTINARIERIKLIIKWGVENELVDPRVSQALQAVAGLRKGRSNAKEAAPVRPVSSEAVNAVLPHLSSVVRDMVRLQLLSGCRPGEIIALRPCDIDREGGAWEYVPARHKTEHHGQQRRICFGPRAQAILSPYLDNVQPMPSASRRARRNSSDGKSNAAAARHPSSPRSIAERNEQDRRGPARATRSPVTAAPSLAPARRRSRCRKNCVRSTT